MGNQKKEKRRRILSSLVIAIGILLACYPLISNFVNSRQADSIATVYQDTVKKTDQKKLKRELRKAKKYNQYLVHEQNNIRITDPFKATLEKAAKEPYPYNTLLNLNHNGIMGYVRIPSIGVKLPVYHGVSTEVLERGIGHIPGTSLPVGGKSTHSVLTGHTGLARAKLFTDLTKVKKGDLFFVYVCGETLAYKVNRIYIIKPHDVATLQIQKGKDKVTLLTCYPYGVNTHRYCVEGVRTAYHKQDQTMKDTVPADSRWLRSYFRAVFVGLLIAAGMISSYLLWKKRKKTVKRIEE